MSSTSTSASGMSHSFEKDSNMDLSSSTRLTSGNPLSSLENGMLLSSPWQTRRGILKKISNYSNGDETSRPGDTPNSSQGSVVVGFDYPSTILDLSAKLWQHICDCLSLRDWFHLSQVCRKLSEIVYCLRFPGKVSIDVYSDILEINPRAQLKFQDHSNNALPRRYHKSEVLQTLNCATDCHTELGFLLSICPDAQRLEFVDTVYASSDKRLFGRNVFDLLSRKSFSNLIYLNLSNTIFNCYHMEEGCRALSALQTLIIDNCTIHIVKPPIQVKCDSILKRRVIGYKSKLMTSGMKWFLLGIQELFPVLELIQAGETIFLSIGCIVYHYGQEDINSTYKLNRLFFDDDSFSIKSSSTACQIL